MDENQIGAAAGAVIENAKRGTGLIATSAAKWSDLPLAVLDNLPERLDDTMLAKVEAIASCPLPDLEKTDWDHFVQAMALMSILPRKAEDDLKAEVRTKLYWRHFAQLPRDAINFLTEHATIECRFFPTPAECQEIINRWKRRDDAPWQRAKAEARARVERQLRFDETLERLERREIPDEQLAELDEWTLKVAETRSYLWLNPDGSYRVRPEPPRPEPTEETEQ